MNKCLFILHSHQNCFILTSSSTPQQNFATPHVENHCSWPNFFRLHRPGSGSSISSKYVGITRSLATRRTLGIPKLLKCINKAQPEPCCKKKNTAPEQEPCLRKQRAPELEPEPIHFYKSSETLLQCENITAVSYKLLAEQKAFTKFGTFVNFSHDQANVLHNLSLKIGSSRFGLPATHLIALWKISISA